MKERNEKIAILGAGPTGLGAAYRLKEAGYKNFKIYERNSYVGGLCASFKDNNGFTWDLGGHVIFSRYEYYNKLVDSLFDNQYTEHKRSAWIRTMGLWVPYPFQHNLKYLPQDIATECIKTWKEAKGFVTDISNFQEWILYNMGEGIAKYFMFPYNFKVWAHPLDQLNIDWIHGRVSPVSLEGNCNLLQTKKEEWGPNATFKFPLLGGTGEIFRRIARLLEGKVVLNSEIARVDTRLKRIYFSDGREDGYDILINTSPLDKFIRMINNPEAESLNAVSLLRHNGVFIVGIGFRKPCPTDKSWVYFPDTDSPFFRMTYFSNYSPYHTPDAKRYYSIICETAYSEHKKENKEEIIEKTINGLISSGIITAFDREYIVDYFIFDIDYAYPIPDLMRDQVLKTIQSDLEANQIYSRGRFGGWKYENGNTDHSFMQGKEVVDRILNLTRKSVEGP